MTERQERLRRSFSLSQSRASFQASRETAPNVQFVYAICNAFHKEFYAKTVPDVSAIPVFTKALLRLGKQRLPLLVLLRSCAMCLDTLELCLVTKHLEQSVAFSDADMELVWKDHYVELIEAGAPDLDPFETLIPTLSVREKALMTVLFMSLQWDNELLHMRKTVRGVRPRKKSRTDCFVRLCLPPEAIVCLLDAVGPEFFEKFRECFNDMCTSMVNAFPLTELVEALRGVIEEFDKRFAKHCKETDRTDIRNSFPFVLRQRPLAEAFEAFLKHLAVDAVCAQFLRDVLALLKVNNNLLSAHFGLDKSCASTTMTMIYSLPKDPVENKIADKRMDTLFWNKWAFFLLMQIIFMATTLRLDFHIDDEKIKECMVGVMLTAMFFEDPLLTSSLEHNTNVCLVFTREQFDLLWRSSIIFIAPLYGISPKESDLPLEHNWRSYFSTRISPERPKDMPFKRYLVSRVFSCVFRERGCDLRKWTHWEQELWRCNLSFDSLSFLEMQDCIDHRRMHDILYFLKRNNVTSLRSMNVQNSEFASSDIALLPERGKSLNLSSCSLSDEDIAALVKRCPDVEVLCIRNNDKLTDKCLVYLEECTRLRILDISGAIFITESARQDFEKKRPCKIKFDQEALDIMQRFIGNHLTLGRMLTDSLKKHLAAQSPDNYTIGTDFQSNFVQGVNNALQGLSDEIFQHVAVSLQERVFENLHPMVLLIIEDVGIPALPEVMKMDTCWLNCGLYYQKTRDAKRIGKSDLIQMVMQKDVIDNQVNSLTTFEKAFTTLACQYFKELDFTSQQTPNLMIEVLSILKSKSIVLGKLMMNSETALSVKDISAVLARTRKLVVVGGFPTKRFRGKFDKAAKKQGSCVEFVPFVGNNARSPFYIFASTVCQKMCVTIKKHLASMGMEAPAKGARHPMDTFLIIVKDFELSVQKFMYASGVGSTETVAQFLCRCASMLSIPHIAALEYTGNIFQLAEEQIAAVWRWKLAELDGAHDASLSVRDRAIVSYVSLLLSTDPMSRDLQDVLLLEDRLPLIRADMSTVTELPELRCEVPRIVIENCQDTLGIVYELVQSVMYEQALEHLEFVHCGPITDDQKRQLRSHFPNLKTITTN